MTIVNDGISGMETGGSHRFSLSGTGDTNQLPSSFKNDDDLLEQLEFV